MDLYLTVAIAVLPIAVVMFYWLYTATPPGPKVNVIGNDGGNCGTSMAFGSIGDDGTPFQEGGSLNVTANKGGISTYALAARKTTEKGFQIAWQTAKVVLGLDRYKMEAVPRGLCLIINNITFGDKFPSRHSSRETTEPLKKLFNKCHLKTYDRNNMSADGMMKAIGIVARADHSQYDCFVCFVLSHGEDGVLLGSDGKTVQLKEFISAVSDQHCPTLKGKPKMFFIEACRTGDPTKAAALLKSLSEFLSSPDGDGDPELLDYFVGYSTQMFNKSFRNNESGDIYTEEFIRVMNDQGEREDLLSIMTKVNENVDKRGVYDRKGERRTQFPDMWIKLRKKVYF